MPRNMLLLDHGYLKLFQKHMTYIVFGGVLVFSVLSVWLSLYLSLIGLTIVGLSILCNVAALVRSERQGFVRAQEMRRAYEPARHFNALQTLLIFTIILAQMVWVTYSIADLAS